MSDSRSPEAPATRARRLIRSLDRAALASALAGDGRPYASLVLAAADAAGEPLLLLSDLAEHSRNIAAEPRVSLLFDGTAGLEDPLTGPRASVLGTARPATDEAAARRFLARHPAARGYAGFADFRFYRVAVERVHLVAGFGAIDWIAGDAVRLDLAGAEPLLLAEADILAHMNADHGDALDASAGALLGLPGSGWRMTGVDPEGIDLRLAGAVARLDFDAPVRDPEAARRALVALAREARAAAPGDAA